MQLDPWIELIEALNSNRLNSKYPFSWLNTLQLKHVERQFSILSHLFPFFSNDISLLSANSFIFAFFICIAIRFEFSFFKEFEIYWFDISTNSTNDWQFIGQLLEQNILFACNSESDQMRVS